jgi:hypothetical protein
MLEATACDTQADSSAIATGRSSLSDEGLQAAAADLTCETTAIPTIFGWEGDGAWVLDLEQSDVWVRTLKSPVHPNATCHVSTLQYRRQDSSYFRVTRNQGGSEMSGRVPSSPRGTTNLS